MDRIDGWIDVFLLGDKVDRYIDRCVFGWEIINMID